METKTIGFREEASVDTQSFEYEDVPPGALKPAKVQGELGVLGPFRVKSLLMRGGMGSVFRAEDMTLGREVALKVIRPDLAADSSARERFLREARAAASIQHDHIVSVHQIGEERGVLYLAMPLLSGCSLEASLKVAPKRSYSEILRIGREIAEGLSGAHQAGLIHRDVKPANIWLEGERGRVKLLDFGLACSDSAGHRLTQDGLILGTPSFMAPEQVGDAKNIDRRCDLFSLGVVLYTMITGRRPFEGVSTVEILLSIVNDEPVPPAVLRPGIPRAVNDLVMRLLEKKPNDRPRSALEVVELITAIENPNGLSGILLEPVGESSLAPLTKSPSLIGNDAFRGLLPALALFCAILLIASYADVWFATNGELVIEGPTPYVKVSIEQQGRRIALMDSGAKRHLKLRPGIYELRIEGRTRGLHPEHERIHLRGAETVNVRLVPDVEN